MATKEQILNLINELSENDKYDLIEELKINNMPSIKTTKDFQPSNCPRCNSGLFMKYGKRNGQQRYKCKSCCKIFLPHTGTPLNKIRKTEEFEKYKKLMVEGFLPIKEMAKRTGISIQTAFDWRHKVLSEISDGVEQFEGVTEIDDIWFLYSQKGRKGLQYSRKRGGSSRAGDNGFQTKLLITSDRKSKTDMSVTRIGRLKKSDIQRTISGKFSNNCTLVSDKHRSIASFANSEGIKHISFRAKDHTAGGEHHIQNVNSIASRLKSVINHSLRGVSTKYLQSYANWMKIREKGISVEELDTIVLNNRNATAIHINREQIYKTFISNFSERTYRCPVKRTFKSSNNEKT
jgi:transposase-like protein